VIAARSTLAQPTDRTRKLGVLEGYGVDDPVAQARVKALRKPSKVWAGLREAIFTAKSAGQETILIAIANMHRNWSLRRQTSFSLP
jgi:hypothetical protein